MAYPRICGHWSAGATSIRSEKNWRQADASGARLEAGSTVKSIRRSSERASDAGAAAPIGYSRHGEKKRRYSCRSAVRTMRYSVSISEKSSPIVWNAVQIWLCLQILSKLRAAGRHSDTKADRSPAGNAGSQRKTVGYQKSGSSSAMTMWTVSSLPRLYRAESGLMQVSGQSARLNQLSIGRQLTGYFLPKTNGSRIFRISAKHGDAELLV